MFYMSIGYISGQRVLASASTGPDLVKLRKDKRETSFHHFLLTRRDVGGERDAGPKSLAIASIGPPLSPVRPAPCPHTHPVWDSPNLILRLWCQPTVMRMIFALAIALVVINQWDQNYNNGTLTRAGFSLARALGHSFGIYI
jgi:hypothetical protein